MNNGKACNRCLIFKPFTDFFKDKRHSTGYYSICKACKGISVQQWRIDNRQKYNADMRAYGKKHRRRIHYKQHYGMTPEDYLNLLKAQKNLCAICEKPASSLGPNKRPMAIDHCHETGKVRGILCYGCNRAIAILDNPELHKRALAYLAK